MNEPLINPKDPSQMISTKEKLFFGAADLYGGGAQALITAVYVVFLIVNGLTFSQAGLIVMIARLWDAVSDPLMGIITDNTRTKWGRRRPYLFGGGLLIIVAFTLLFLPLYNMNTEWLKFAIYLVSYLFYCTISTVINVPYSSMSAEISQDFHEKTKVNSIRLIFSMVSSGISAVIPLLLINNLRTGAIPVREFSLYMIFIFGIFYTIPLVLAAIFCKERAQIPAIKTVFSFKAFFRPLKVRAFVFLLLFYLCAYTCMDIITVNIIYFADYGINFGMEPFIILVVLMVSYALSVPFLMKMMSKGWAKPKLFRLGIPLYIVGIVALCLYPQGWPDWPILVLAAIIGVGLSGTQMMPWIIFPDVVDVGELKLNDRPTGSFSGIMTFIRKSTSALAIFITATVLDLVNFKPPQADPITGLVPDEIYIPPMSAVWGLRLVIMISVLVFISIAFIFARKLTLNPKRSIKIREFIDLQKEGKLDEEHLSAEDWAEYNLIKKELF